MDRKLGKPMGRDAGLGVQRSSCGLDLNDGNMIDEPNLRLELGDGPLKIAIVLEILTMYMRLF